MASSNSVTAGDQVTLTAKPNAGYQFVNWTLNGNVVSTDATYTFTPTASGEYVANFEKVTPPVVELPEVTNGFIKGDGVLRFYRLALPITLSSYTSDFGSSATNVTTFWREAETYLNKLYIPLGICFDVIEDARLIAASRNYIDDNRFNAASYGTELTNGMIGEDAYDVGMWIAPPADFDNSGVSALSGAYSTTAKGSGYAKKDVAVVAHELGHLFGAQHVHDKGSATEPEFGSSIMGYGDQLPFFSVASIKAIREEMMTKCHPFYADAARTTLVGTDGGYNYVYGVVVSSNAAPQFAGTGMNSNYNIPKGACFAMPINASDANGDRITYAFQQYEDGAKFHAYAPQENNVVDFRPNYIIWANDDNEFTEVGGTNIPEMAAGAYNFAAVVNDVPAEANMTLAAMQSNPFYAKYETNQTRVTIVDGTAFTVSLEPNKASYAAGEKVTVSWGVNTSYFDTQKVNILLSDDYGKTFEYTLAENVDATSGICQVTMPDLNLTTVREQFGNYKTNVRPGIIRVEVVNDIAYSLSWTNPASATAEGGFLVTGGSGEGGGDEGEGEQTEDITAEKAALSNLLAEMKAYIAEFATVEKYVMGGYTDYQVTFTADHGAVTADMVAEAYRAMDAAEATRETATTKAELNTSIAALQTKLTDLQTNKSLPGEGEGGEGEGGEGEDLTADKAALLTLIEQTEALIASCGEVVYKPATEDAKLALQVDEPTGEYYLSTNADQNVVGTKNDGDGIGALLDGNTSSYMHTQWDGEAVDDDHYVQVTLNSAKQLGAFTFTYATRAGASADMTSPAPTIIKVYTSADGSTFTDSGISFTDKEEGNPLPDYSELGVYWTSSQIELNNPKAIRFYVTGSAGPGANNYGGHQFFAMSEFGLTALGTPESYETTVNPGTEVTSEQLLATYEEVIKARAALLSATTVAELTAAKEALDARYNELLEASKNSTTDDFADEKKALQTLIEQTNSLLETSATVTTSEKEQATKLALQTTNDQADAHLYCNAPYVYDKNSTDYSPANKGYWLLDGDDKTFLHTNWDNSINSADGLDHYIRVYSAEALDKFTFTYTTRWNENGEPWVGNPTVIEVEGCNTPNGTYESIATLSDKGTNPLPTQYYKPYAQVYTSDLLTASAPYKYIRFRVTATEQNKTAYGHKWFYISEFAFSKVETVKVYEAVLHGSNGVTEAIAIDTYKAVEEATAALSATTADELTAAKAALQAQYEVLLAASNSNVDKAALRTIIDQTQALVDACYDVKDGNKVFKYGGSLYITEADAQEAAAAVETAEATYNLGTLTQTQCDAEVTRMKGVYEKLAYAVSHATLPVRVTTDLAKPYIYTIGINRSATSLLEWDANTSMVAVAGKYELGNEAQAWCFFDATDGCVYIAPYQEFSSSSYRVLSSKDLSEGNSKVIDVVKGTDGFTQEWTIVYNANKNMYNIYCLNDKGDKYYFSNHTSINHKMGFYNDVNDPGSLFSFEERDAKSLSYSDAYNKLYNFVHNDVKVQGTVVGDDSRVGFYTEAMANAYNNAYSAANSALKEEADDATCEARYDALSAANSALHINLPMDGKVYRFRSAANHDYCNGAFVYADVNDNKLRWKKSDATAEAATLWSFTAVGTSGYTLQNLHTGTYMQNFVANNPSPLTESNSASATIVSLSSNGQVGIKINGTMMHAQKDYNAVVHWNTEAGGASAWLVEEVDLSEVQFPVSISKYGYAGLYLNYPANISDGVEAYVVKKATGEDGVAVLDKIEGGIIPANTGVILKSQEAHDAQEAKEYVLTHAASDGVEPEVSLLEGANYLKYVKAEPETDYYLFGAKNSVVGLYKAYEEYNIGGTTGFTEITEPGGTLNGVYPIAGNTYYLCNKQTSGEDVVFSVANGAIAFNKEKKIDDSYRWLCSKNDDGTYVFKNVATNQYFAWQGLSNKPYSWNLYDKAQTNGGGKDLQTGCVSMKNGKYLIVKGASGWDQSTEDGYYESNLSSSFYFEKYEAKSTSKTNDGGYFKCSANKIYLPYSAVDNAAKFSFRFDGGTTTDLEEALFGNDAKEEIFDLQGRRVERITAPGLYIVNGKKRYVKAAKF